MARLKLVCALFLFLLFQIIKSSNGDISISTKKLLLQKDDLASFNVTITNLNATEVQISFLVQNEDIVSVRPENFTLEPFDKSYELFLRSKTAGHSEVSLLSNATNIDLSQVYVVVNVYNSYTIEVLSKISGWIYIISWGSSFYPQIWRNYKRKSVVGLNFDYVALNLLGYLSFGVFILGLYFIPYLQQEYYNLHPRSLIPVKSNDVVYNLHGIFAILITILQCFLYEKGNQAVSTTAKSVMGVFALFYIVCGIIVAANGLTWLSFIYYCSYIKLLITVLKYIPQAYMNYKRKSTSGWSIGLVLLDMTGGFLSVVQMILDAYNYNDWVSIVGNPTKFGLGLFNMFVHTLFIVQHYVLYKKKSFIAVKT